MKTKFLFLLIFINHVVFAQNKVNPMVDLKQYKRTIINNKVGFVNKDNDKQILIPFEYEVGNEDEVLDNVAKYDIVTDYETESVSEVMSIDKDTLLMNVYFQHLLPVKKNGKYGFINANNNTVIPFEYEEADRFRQLDTTSFAIVKKNGKYGVIDLNNKIILNFDYEKLYYIPDYAYYIDLKRSEKAFDNFYAEKNGYVQTINLKGKRICSVNEGKYGINRYECSEQ